MYVAIRRPCVRRAHALRYTYKLIVIHARRKNLRYLATRLQVKIGKTKQHMSSTLIKAHQSKARQ